MKNCFFMFALALCTSGAFGMKVKQSGKKINIKEFTVESSETPQARPTVEQPESTQQQVTEYFGPKSGKKLLRLTSINNRTSDSPQEELRFNN